MATEVVVEAAGPAEAERAAELAARLGFPMASGPVEVGFSLCVGPERVELIEHGPGAPGPVYVDFVGGAVGHRRRFGGGRGQSIAKAVGLKGGASPNVIDATAGLGRDGFVLAQLGCQVTLVERHPVSAALLEDGIARALHDPEVGPVVEERMRLVQGNAVDYLGSLDEAQRPDVVYLDPMFPKRQKSAQVKKEMVALQRIVGGDEDSDALLDAALAVARKRVVVKRPAGAPPLAGRRPSATIDTKKNRFDVYVIAAL